MSAGPSPRSPEQPDENAVVRRSPSGRIPQWALDEAAGMPILDDVPWRDHTAGPPYPGGRPTGRRRRRWSRAALLTVTIAALVIATWFYSGSSLMPQAGTGQDPRFAVAGTDETDLARGSFTVDPPTPGYESESAPLGTPVPLADQSTSYQFMNLPNGEQQFIAYDPCRPVHYAVRADRMPADGQRMITEAVANISAATGLQFVYDGLSEEEPSERRPLVQDERYGDRWAPILIAWATPQENPDLQGETIGLGGSSFVSIGSSPAVYVSGSMMLDAPQISTLLKFPNGYEQARAIVQHELGHIVGLDHVEDRTQLMYAESNLEVTSFGAGDLAGLAQLGRGVCVPEL